MEDLLILAVSASTWALSLLGVFLIGFWLLEVSFFRTKKNEELSIEAKDVQVRILTIDSKNLVQETVDGLPDCLNDVNVIAEEDISINGAQVHIVPDEFKCNSERKGRALEWASREITNRKEFVLYLDEDSLLTEFKGLPDSDIVQLREQPRYTGSPVTFSAEVFRMGIQLEQIAFPGLEVHLFAWGGGIAIRDSLERKVTWNRPSLVEDTAFVWRAAITQKASFEISDINVQNQSPLTIVDLLKQRRRWAGGNMRELENLPPRYRFLTWLRNYSWGLTPFSALAAPLATLSFSDNLIGEGFLSLLGVSLSIFLLIWYTIGVFHYRERKLIHLLGLILLPLGALVHSLGALWGIISPPDTFEVTPKDSN